MGLVFIHAGSQPHTVIADYSPYALSVNLVKLNAGGFYLAMFDHVKQKFEHTAEQSYANFYRRFETNRFIFLAAVGPFQENRVRRHNTIPLTTRNTSDIAARPDIHGMLKDIS